MGIFAGKLKFVFDKIFLKKMHLILIEQIFLWLVFFSDELLNFNEGAQVKILFR